MDNHLLKAPAPRQALERIAPYVAAKTIESVRRELGRTDILKLAGNENTAGCSPLVRGAVLHALQEASYYPDMQCTVLREKLSALHGVQPDQFVFGNGSFELISLAAQTFLNTGDEAIMFSPSFGWYQNATLQTGANIIQVPLTNFTVNLPAALRCVTDRTKIIWLCNPNNPTGTICTEARVRALLQALPPHILLVLDEAYVDFVEDPSYPNSIGMLKEFPNLLILRTFSKVYGLASFRLGYGIASEDTVAAINKVRLPINTNILAQAAAIASLNDPDFRRTVLENNHRGLALYYEALDALGLRYIRSNCNFILFDTGVDSEWVVQEYYRRGVLIRSGAEFGLPSWVRISIGSEAENRRVLKILREILPHMQSSATPDSADIFHRCTKSDRYQQRG